jgi:hypothetical protein
MLEQRGRAGRYEQVLEDDGRRTAVEPRPEVADADAMRARPERAGESQLGDVGREAEGKPGPVGEAAGPDAAAFDAQPVDGPGRRRPVPPGAVDVAGTSTSGPTTRTSPRWLRRTSQGENARWTRLAASTSSLVARA